MFELVADVLAEVSAGNEVPINDNVAFVLVDIEGCTRFGLKYNEEKMVAILDPTLFYMQAIIEHSMTVKAKNDLRMNRRLH